MWLLDYDGALLMRLPAEETDAFLAGGFYKLFLRRYVKEALPGFLRFKPALAYLDYKKVIELLGREAEKRGQSFTVSNALRDYIDAREMHIEIRSRLGSELKKHDPKLAERYEKYKKTVDGRMVRPLRERQMWDSFFMCSMQKSANFSVPGSGKTASVLGMYAYLSAKGLVKRILVICPKNAFGSWMDEFAACYGAKEPLRVLNIHDASYKGTRDRRRALEYESGGCNLILVNYESVGQLDDLLKTLAEDRTLLVFDEVHKVKRIGGEYASHALAVAQDAAYVVALTGTPLPNAYTDIYNLLHILFPYEYEEFFGFTPALLRKPTAQDVQAVNDKLQPFFCRTTKDQLGVPRANPDTMVPTEAGADENRILKILSMKYKKNKLALLIRILQLESNPRALLESLSLRDFEYLLDDDMDADEIDYADYSGEIRTLIEGCGTPSKFRKCVELTERLTQEGKPVVLWCIFIDSIHRLSAELEKRGVRCRCVYGEVPLEERQEFLRFLVPARRGLLFHLLDPVFHRLQVLDLQFHVHDFLVPDRVHGTVDMNDIAVVEAAEDVQDGVGFPDVREELVSETLSLGSALHQTGDVHDFHRGGNGALGLADLRKDLQALVRHIGGADIRFDGAERVVGALGLPGTDAVK